MNSTSNFFDHLDFFLEKLLGGKNLQPQDELEKKYMLTQGIFAISGLILMLIVAWAVSAKLVAEFCLVYIPIMLISSLFFYLVKKPAIGILIFKIIMILVSSVYIARMGGLITSGGLFLLTIQAVTSSVVMRNFKSIMLVSTVFIISMILLIFLQPYFPAENVLNPKQNFIIFSLNIIAVTGFIFFFSVYAVNLFSKMEQRETQRQKELNDAKTRLYTNITHEFRTPLTVILGLADSVKSQSNGTVAPKMDTIIKNGKNLLQLVDQMLDLSKLESGNLTVNKIHGNIIPFLRYVFQLQEFYAVEKQIEMKFQVESQSY